MKSIYFRHNLFKCLGGIIFAMIAAPGANAGFVFFNLPGLHAGESARVAEQIVCADILCSGLDYQFFVLNTGARAIDGVALGLGAVPGPIPIGTLKLASANGGGDGPFPNVVAGNFGGTAVLGIPSGGAPVAAGPGAWGFEEFQDNGGGGFPNTFYAVRWYSPVQGIFAASLNPGRFTRLDLFTVFGPAGGSGAVDPPAITEPYFGFDSIDGNGNAEFNPDTLTNDGISWPQPCDPATDTNCSIGTTTDLMSDSAFSTATSDLAAAPEPGTVSLLLGSALVGFSLLQRRRPNS